jgi:hypothetical protein
MATEAELAEFDKLFAADVENIKDSLSGEYAAHIRELLDLSGRAQAGGIPAVAAAETYSQLIALIQRASAMNLSQAQLKSRIVALGDTAVSVAKKVSGLAKLFV